MPKKTVPLLVLVLLVSLIVGCVGPGETVAPIDLVPQTASMVGQVNLSQILDDEDLAEIYDMVPKDGAMPETFDAALDAVAERIGVDLRDFEEMLFFAGAASPASDAARMGAIARGDFEQGEVIAAVEEALNGRLNADTMKGHVVYTGPREEAAITFLSDDALVIGTTDMVADVIDVKEGDEAALSGDLLDKYNGLGDALIRVVASATVEGGGDGPADGAGLPGFPIELPFLGDMETAAMRLAKEQQSIAFDLELCFASSESAETLAALINLVKSWPGVLPVPEEGPGGIPIPEAGEELLPELLERLEVDAADSCLEISLQITMAELKELLAQ